VSHAYISRFRSTSDGYKMQLITYADTGYGDLLAEVEIPQDELTISLAEDFLYDLAAAKDLEVKARRGNDE
jgi:hypothetical protein